jgi:hypothetical protein
LHADDGILVEDRLRPAAKALGMLQEKRAYLEALNREPLEAQRQLDRASTDDGRRVAASRGAVAASRLLEHVKTCPYLIRVDLTSARPGLEPAEPFELPRDSGTFLFEVVTHGEGLSCATTVFDLPQPPGESSLMSLDVATNGTTYVVACLEHLPLGRTILGAEFRRSGQAGARLPLDVTTPGPGRVKLTGLSDDIGRPTPAMVRLMWRTDGLARQPTNGIEFATQFDKQGKASGARNESLPGALKEAYWCVPGPFDMALAPREW